VVPYHPTAARNQAHANYLDKKIRLHATPARNENLPTPPLPQGKAPLKNIQALYIINEAIGWP